LTKGSTIINIQRYISITKPTQRNHEKRSFHRRSPCDRYGVFFSNNLNRNVMKKSVEEIRELLEAIEVSMDELIERKKAIDERLKEVENIPELEDDSVIKKGDRVVVLNTDGVHQYYKVGHVLEVDDAYKDGLVWCSGHGFIVQAFQRDQIQKIIE